MNVIARLEFELMYYESTVRHCSHHTAGTFFEESVFIIVIIICYDSLNISAFNCLLISTF